MIIADLRQVLDGVAHLCLSAGAKGAAKDLKILIDALDGHAEIDVSAFRARIEQRLTEASAKPKGRRKASTAPKSVSLNDDVIRQHVFALRSAGTNRESFDKAFETLRTDKSLKAAEVAEIARQYADSVTKYKSVKSAHADIPKAFVRQARFENKLR